MIFKHTDSEIALKEFPKFQRGLGYPNQICLMVNFLNAQYQRTKKELHELFTLDEVLVIYQAYFSSMHTIYDFSSKVSLITDIADMHRYNIPIREVNVEKLVDKFQKLSEFQCFTIIMMVIEVRDREESSQDFVEQVIDMFKPVEQ